LLDAGIDEVSTLNTQHLASLNDVVEQITGTRQHERVPDEVVRSAESAPARAERRSGGTEEPRTGDPARATMDGGAGLG
jgi:hypothetical protein